MNGAMDERSAVWPVDELRTNPKVSAAACVRTSRDYVCHELCGSKGGSPTVGPALLYLSRPLVTALWLRAMQKFLSLFFTADRESSVGKF